MPDYFIEMRNINKHFGGVHAIKDFDFDVTKGEIHCLVGKNGCGKSTLIKIISGVYKPDDGGDIVVFGQPVKNITPQISQENGIYVIYQDLSLFPNLTVAENIAFNQHTNKIHKGVVWRRIRKEAKETLQLMQVELELDKDLSTLSIADRQLVAIARALTANAKVLIMDEPTSSLTRREVDNLFKIVNKLRADGLTIIFVSHKTDEIIEIADRITVMRDGVKIGTYNKDAINADTLVELISGQNIVYEQSFVQPNDKTVLEVSDLSCGAQYENISFSLKEGEILGIIGLLGSGRTELALSLFGMNKPQSGEIRIEGIEVDFKNNQDAINNKIAYVPEDRLLQGLAIDQNIEDNMTLTILDRIKTKLRLLDVKKRRSLTEYWIDALEIKSAAPKVQISKISGGNQQKAVIAKWLATEPKILILDQPTNGVDVAAKDAIYKIVHNLARKKMSIILISDEVPEIYYNCQRALIMHRGKLAKEIDCSAISEEEFSEVILNAQ